MATALITGASSGIGFELAKLFCTDGYNVILVADNEAKLDKAATELSEHSTNGNIGSLVADLTHPNAAQEVYAQVKASGVQVDILVNNAGVGVYGDFARETDISDEQHMLQLNVMAPLELTKLFVKDMLDRGHGKILFTSSVVGVVPAPNLLVYSASKAFLYHFAIGLREELSESGITVTALLPGVTDTQFYPRAGMEHTEIAQGDMDTPAHVAKHGYEGLMNNEDHVVVSMNNKIQVMMSKVMPISKMAAQSRVK